MKVKLNNIDAHFNYLEDYLKQQFYNSTFTKSASSLINLLTASKLLDKKAENTI